MEPGAPPTGAVHPDLANRLAGEAASTADYVLHMCIRALDYLPPVDVTFFEYLRALITADFDLVRDDKNNYRVAFVEAFRRRGIYPPGVRSLAVDSLLWQATGRGTRPAKVTGRRCNSAPTWRVLARAVKDWRLAGSREEVVQLSRGVRAAVHGWFTVRDGGPARALEEGDGRAWP